MRRRILRAVWATAAAGATVIGLTMTAAGTASAAQVPPAVTGNSAGWAAGNVLAPTILRTSSTWNFRYASATTVVPDQTSPNVALNGTVENFTAQLSNQKATAVARLYWNGAAWHVGFAQYYRNGAAATQGTCAHVWLTGSTVRLDVYYNRDNGALEFSAYDGPDRVCSDSMAAWTPDSSGGGAYREAYSGGVFTTSGDPYGTAAFTRPSADLRLFPVTGVRYTSYNGTKGTVSGPWQYQELIYGTSTSNVYADAPVLWNGGANFGVWLRP